MKVLRHIHSHGKKLIHKSFVPETNQMQRANPCAGEKKRNADQGENQ